MKIKRVGVLFIVISLIFLMIPSVDSYAGSSMIKLNKTFEVIPAGKSINLKVSGTNKQIKWSSSNKNIATVSSKGKVTGKKSGKTIIKAKIGKKTYKCNISVVKSGTKTTISNGEYYTLYVKEYPSKYIDNAKATNIKIKDNVFYAKGNWCKRSYSNGKYKSSYTSNKQWAFKVSSKLKIKMQMGLEETPKLLTKKEFNNLFKKNSYLECGGIVITVKNGYVSEIWLVS